VAVVVHSRLVGWWVQDTRSFPHTLKPVVTTPVWLPLKAVYLASKAVKRVCKRLAASEMWLCSRTTKLVSGPAVTRLESELESDPATPPFMIIKATSQVNVSVPVWPEWKGWGSGADDDDGSLSAGAEGNESEGDFGDAMLPEKQAGGETDEVARQWGYLNAYVEASVPHAVPRSVPDLATAGSIGQSFHLTHSHSQRSASAHHSPVVHTTPAWGTRTTASIFPAEGELLRRISEV
jgi:hypothetical protein